MAVLLCVVMPLLAERREAKTLPKSEFMQDVSDDDESLDQIPQTPRRTSPKPSAHALAWQLGMIAAGIVVATIGAIVVGVCAGLFKSL